jgi:hypothetical protein
MSVMSWTFALGEVVLVGVGILMVITNPEQKAYEKYATQQIDNYVKENVCSQLSPGLSNVLEGQCHAMLDVARPQLQETIAKQTTRQNFLLFSVYQTELSLPFSMLDYNFYTLGFCQNFFVYQTE